MLKTSFKRHWGLKILAQKSITSMATITVDVVSLIRFCKTKISSEYCVFKVNQYIYIYIYNDQSFNDTNDVDSFEQPGPVPEHFVQLKSV